MHHFVLLWDENLPLDNGHLDLHGPCCSSLILLESPYERLSKVSIDYKQSPIFPQG